MLRLTHRTLTSLLCAMLWAGHGDLHARDVQPSEPLRVTLVSLARQATSADKLSVRRVQLAETQGQAKLCALATDSRGQPVMDRDRFEVRRFHFERHRGQWRVQRSDTAWLAVGGSLEAVCPASKDPVSAPTQWARSAAENINVALAEMARHPPTAGRPDENPSPSATRCVKDQAGDSGHEGWPRGRVGPAGRSLLFDAPDNACLMGKHLVQNDQVRLGRRQGAWTQVRYTHPITGVITLGWLPSHRVTVEPDPVVSASR